MCAGTHTRESACMHVGEKEWQGEVFDRGGQTMIWRERRNRTLGEIDRRSCVQEEWGCGRRISAYCGRGI